MEIFLALSLLAVLVTVATGKVAWLFVALLVGAWSVGRRAYKKRCRGCGGKVLTVPNLKYCNQCGSQIPAGRFRIRCSHCKKLARSELSLNFCNQCGAAVESTP